MTSELYNALADKDQHYVDKYYAAVESTRIYCQMNCPCKKPLPENVSFYDKIEQCLIRGYRACKVCKPLSDLARRHLAHYQEDTALSNYIAWLGKEVFPAKSYREHPLQSADELASIKKQFQKVFGISLGQYIRLKRCGHILKTDTKTKQYSNVISYGFLSTPLGEMVACYIDEELLLLEFIDRKSLETELGELQKLFQGYFKRNENSFHTELSQQLSEYFDQKRDHFTIKTRVVGTDFQKRVWEELSTISYGEIISYAEQAKRLGQPSAVRAIASANGKNMIAIIIPCHRVIASNGKMAGYGGGIDRKKSLLRMENDTTTTPLRLVYK